jgi:malonyl-CoA/methylmalonyl-CoA synthetase
MFSAQVLFPTDMDSTAGLLVFQPSSKPQEKPGFMSENLYAFFRSRFADSGSQTALRTPDDRRIRYDELDALTARYGNTMLDMGLKPGDRVAVLIDKSPEAIILYLACVRAGLIHVPLNTAYKQAEVDRFVTDCEPSLIVDASILPSLAEKAATQSPVLDPASSEIAVLLYTSGTTGRPKGAMMGHGQLIAKAAALVMAWGWTHNDVLLHAMPVFHTHGLFMSLSGALAAAAETLMLPKFSVEDVVSHLPESTVFTGVPTMYSRLLAADNLAEASRGMRLFVCGSAALPPSVFDAFAERTGQQIVECWGMTELPTCTSNPLAGDRRHGTVGRVMPGTEIRIVDRTGNPLPTGSTGEVEVRSEPPFPGYWGDRPDPLRSDGFFMTGDLGQISEDGYLSIVGRTKEVVITGGYNIYPREIEDTLRRIDGIEDAAIIGLPHPDFGEGVTAVIEGDLLPESAEIKEILKSTLAAYKVPKEVIIVDRLPRNATGKVRKDLLRKQLRNIYGSDKP